MGVFIEHLSKGVRVRNNCPVETVQYGGSQGDVLLHCGGGRRIRCNKVIITVPLRVLQVWRYRHCRC